MELEQAIKSRYSERYYKNVPVDSSLINELLIAAWHAPSSCNMQTVQYLVVTDKDLQQNLAKIATKKLNWAPVNLLLLLDNRIGLEHDAAIVSLGAATQNILLRATSLGLASCPMAGFSNDSLIKKYLGIPEYFDVKLIIGVGYPESQGRTRERLPLDSVTHHNKFKQDGKINLSTKVADWSYADVVDYRSRIAPVYRYENRYSLSIYSPAIYHDILEILKEKIGGVKKCLDVFTYDGVFARDFKREYPSVELTVSDSLDYILNLYSDETDILISKIEKDYIFRTNETFDLITVVQKLEFTPNPDKLLASLSGLLSHEGLVLVTVETKTFLRGVADYSTAYFRKFILRKKVNVYEGSPYYKIGPRGNIKPSRLDDLCNAAGLKKVDSNYIYPDSGGKLRKKIYYGLYKKG